MFQRGPKDSGDDLTFMESPEDQVSQELDKVLYMRKQVGSSYKKWYIIDPRKVSNRMAFWDGLQAVALCFTAFITPLQVAFIDPPTTALDVLFVIDRSIDLVFFMDMCMQPFTMYAKSIANMNDLTERASVIDGSHIWEHNHASIIKHYLATWFAVDFLSIAASVPDIMLVSIIEVDCSGLLDDGNNIGVSAVSKFRLLRVLRVLRLVKLVRLLKASRVLKRGLARTAISYGTMVIVRCVVTLVVCAHWIACMWMLQAYFHPSVMQTWQATFGWCIRGPDPDSIFVPSVCYEGGALPDDTCPAPYLSTIERGVCCVGRSDLYVASLSWAMMIITGVGGTDFIGLGPALNGMSVAEDLVFTVITLFANAILWTQIIAAFVEVATNSNPLNTEFRQTMDHLNEYMRSQALSYPMRQKLREYFQENHYVNVAEANEKVVLKMSPMLQRQVLIPSNKHWLQKLWFLKGSEPAVFVQIILSLQPHVFAPNERTPDEALGILYQGVAIFESKLLTRGNIFGLEGLLLSNKSLRVNCTGRMMTFVHCHMLSKSSFTDIMKRFPKARKAARRATILLALRRRLVKIARIKAGKGKDFISKVIEAAQGEDGDEDGEIALQKKHAAQEMDIGRVREVVKSEVDEALEPMHKAVRTLLAVHGLDMSSDASLVMAEKSKNRRRRSAEPVPGTGFSSIPFKRQPSIYLPDGQASAE